MTSHLTPRDFEHAVRTIFTTVTGGTTEASVAELVLAEVRHIAGSSRAGGGFALTFLGRTPLPQAIYRLTAPGFEADVFIVPVGEEDEGYLHEAIFN